MYVSLTFESTIAGPFPDSSCFMIPIPNLLAEPSRPNAIGMLNCFMGHRGALLVEILMPWQGAVTHG